MSYLYFINYAIFAAFFTLFTVEIGISLFFLFGHHRNETLRRYLMPIWPITGTFAIFYLVNFVATYPSSITLFSSAYLAPILAAAAFFIFRDAFVAYGGYHWHDRMGPRYMRIYAVATIVTAFIAISIFSSGISGIGINIQSGRSNLLAVLVNPFSILMFIAIALFALFLDFAVFDVDKMARLCPIFAVLGIAVVLAAMWLFLPYTVANVGLQLLPLAIVIALLVVTAFFSVIRNRLSRFLPFVWFFIAVNFFGLLAYPYWFGGSIASTNYLANSTTWQYTFWITMIGGALLAVAIACLVYVAYIKDAPRKKGGY